MIWHKNMVRATAEEQARIDRMMTLGCILTLVRELPRVNAECHHLIVGNKRMGALYTIPLSPWYHRAVCLPGWTPIQMRFELGPSITHGSKVFFRAHRITEHELWVAVQKRLGLPTDMPLSKIVRRMPVTGDWA